MPSITICPQIKIRATEMNYTDLVDKFMADGETYANESAEAKRIFEHVTFICQDEISSHKLRDKHTNASLVQDMLQIAPELSQLFYTCVWNERLEFECARLFKTVLTEEGICYNMNSLPIYDILRNNSVHHDYEYMASSPDEQIRGWTEDGYYDPDEKDPYPKRAQSNGAVKLLSITFKELDKYYDRTCNSLNTGFKVFIHQPQDMPTASMHQYSVNPNMKSMLALSFNILNSSDNIRTVSPDIRQCYFPGERDLRYYKIYSASNCELECLANRTMELCHCVFFYMPFETTNKLCRSHHAHCMFDVRESFEKDTCNCLPSCNSIEYEAEILKSDYKLTELFQDPNVQFSALDMYYKRPSYISMRRSLLFGTADFLSNCGGLLGLFLGFSFLSLVEIIYFVSLRPWYALKRAAKEEKE